MDNPEDRFCDNFAHSDKPEFQALRRMADLAAARAEAEEKNKQFRYELTTRLIKEGRWDDGKI